MKSITMYHKKSEKGNALAFFGLASSMLAVMLGLVFQPVKSNLAYPAPETLQQATNAAAQAASAKFKPNHLISDMEAATQSVLTTYNIQPESLTVETCQNTPMDPVLCAVPLKKLVRVRVTALVAPDGLPSTVEAISEAPSLDVMLVIDTSDSMTYDYPDGSSMRDPHECNVGNQCHPMEEIKNAAKLFVDQMYFPYDRVGVVHFNQYGKIDLALSENSTEIKTDITNLYVFEGTEDAILVDGSPAPTRCVYHRDDPDFNFSNRFFQDPVPPHASDGGLDYLSIHGACRLFINSVTGGYFLFDCPLDYGPNPNPSYCGTTNTAAGINLATSALLGIYSGYPGAIPATRPDSIPVMILLSDGAANAAYTSQGEPICPPNTFFNSQSCRDRDASVRHNSSSPDYDADDLAYDMLDIANSNNITIYTVGMGGLVTRIPSDNTGPAPGASLLQYPETTFANGKFYYAPSSSDLNPIYLDIANHVYEQRIFTPAPSSTATKTATATVTETIHVTETPTITKTKTPTITKTRTFTSTVTITPTVTSTHTSTPSQTATPITLTLESIAAQDGWIQESRETSGMGGPIHNLGSTLRLGDSAKDQQYRSILSFNTGSLPDTAVITMVVLKFKKQGVVGGGSPMSLFHGLLIDIKNGFFGSAMSLQHTDFQALPSRTYGPTDPIPVSGVYQINLTNAKSYINKLAFNGGLTQLRLRFKLGDNDNALANILSLYSGNAGTALDHPQLVITYHMP